MNRVTRRAWIMVVFIVMLLGGTGFFVGEYLAKAEDWVSFTGAPHDSGTVVDREGVLLLDTTGGREYASNLAVRQSTLHWLGDRNGHISAPAISHYAQEMSGFDRVNGVYDYAGDGGEAMLTLSSRVQAVALEAMAGRKGTVAVYNYRTGEILCAVTTPNFDPDNVPEMDTNPGAAYEGVYLNRFIQSAYIPGSIFKVVTTAAALDCIGDIEQQSFTCSGVYSFGVDRVTCERAHGTMNLKSALASSCNCTFAQIAQQIGPERMMEYVEQFQVTQSVSFDGITTAKGNYDVTDAVPVELAWSCIGQYTDLVNPCRYMVFMGAVANGGSAAKPHLVSQIQVDGETAYQVETARWGQVMSREVSQTLREYMRNNVQTVYGDGNFPGLSVCAKSGTSELGGGQRSNAMFAGFVADEEYPLAFIVVVENGGYGSATCVPIISKVLAECKSVLDGN